MKLFKNVTLFHAKENGDIDGEFFRGNRVFFADNSDIASAYAEHRADNKLCGKSAYGSDDHLYLGITVFPVIVTFNNPAITDKVLLSEIGRDLNIQDLSKFVENFEDAYEEERNMVFSWLENNGFDSAIMPNDTMPVCANGDWNMQTSYVSFYPETQVRFKIFESNYEVHCNIDVSKHKYSYMDVKISESTDEDCVMRL